MTTERPPHRSSPAAPGRLAEPLGVADAQAYLIALGEWLDARRRELDALDRAALASPDGAGMTADLTLSMALWQAVSDRHGVLLRTWDSGRVGPAERARMATLVWGRLDAATASGLSVSLPEACRLSDALAAQLRVRLGVDADAAQAAERITALRAQLERIRDQVAVEPAGVTQQAAAVRQSGLARRLRDLADKAARGGDVGGMLGPLEIEAATFERDLIVGHARRREDAALVLRVRQQQRDLLARATALRALVDRCVATVDPAPRYAVPDPAALGPLPNTRDALQVFGHRLDQVTRAMDLAERAYREALEEQAELDGRLQAYRAKAQVTGAAGRPEVAAAAAAAVELLARRPCPVPLARAAVTRYQQTLQDIPAPRAEPRPVSP